MKNQTDLLLELEDLPKGYISKKNINGKTYFYLQYKDGKKLVSKYVKDSELKELKSKLARRDEIEKELKNLLSKEKNLNSLSKTTLELSGYIMSEDIVVAEFDKGSLVYIDNNRCPLIIKRTKNLISFLTSRIIDTSRTNARLLKRIIDVHGEDDYLIALKNHAVSVTDNYWFKSKNSRLKYKDVCLESDIYNEISLKGEIGLFPKQAKLSPQFSLLGSYEKCWRLINNHWWMYKVGTKEEIYSELISSRLSKSLGIPTAIYEIDDDYIRTKSFADKYNFETLASLAGDDDSYEHVVNVLLKENKKLAKQYLMLIWFDALVNNVDRHNENVGFLREKSNGKIVSLAPNYDLNMSLFSKTKILGKEKDGFLSFYLRFVKSSKLVKELYSSMLLPILTERMIVEATNDLDLSEYKFNLKEYLLYRYNLLKEAFNL